MVQNIPVYNISIDLNDEETMMTCISLVTDPAVERDFECFDKAKQPMKFAITDTDKHCITGVAIRANALIYRCSYTMGEYYVRFTPKTIEDIVFKYSKMGLWNSVSLEHSGENITDAVMVEYFIKGNGKDPQGFEDVEEGSLFVTYKITNDELWETIKNSNEINGFSIEILADLEPTDEVVKEEVEEDDYEMNNWLAELLSWLADEDDIEIAMSKDEKWLVNGDGEYWQDEDGNKVPAKCPKCGSPVGVYIKGEPVFLCSECGEYLGVVKFPDDMDFSGVKKNFKRITKGDVQDAMSKNRKVNITIGEKTLYEQQIFQLGEDVHGKLSIVVYDPQTRAWSEYDVRAISTLEVTELELENYDFNSTWKKIVENNEVGIIDTAIGHNVGNTFRDAIETNRMVMIDYFDEVNDDGRGFRTCLVTSLGYTTGSDGTPRNQAIRIYEYNGSSHSGLEGGTGNWRFMLTRRIRDFKIVDYVEPVLTAPQGYNGEMQQDSGKNGTMSNVEVVMKFPPIRKA